ncbi:protein of unknown function [Paenibacillus alvei]|uniref:Uncharacterized protein n=1 Tax=Paenibacillus alvei TaxID=44250 RepID=A0A383RES5_PAEAL|nr:protein of unknown function [Paenibacillus alvei]
MLQTPNFLDTMRSVSGNDGVLIDPHLNLVTTRYLEPLNYFDTAFIPQHSFQRLIEITKLRM